MATYWGASSSGFLKNAALVVGSAVAIVAGGSFLADYVETGINADTKTAISEFFTKSWEFIKSSANYVWEGLQSAAGWVAEQFKPDAVGDKLIEATQAQLAKPEVQAGIAVGAVGAGLYGLSKAVSSSPTPNYVAVPAQQSPYQQKSFALAELQRRARAAENPQQKSV